MTFSERLTELEAKHAAATPLPWVADPNSHALLQRLVIGVENQREVGQKYFEAILTSFSRTTDHERMDLEFIAAMRNELPNLLAMAKLAGEMRDELASWARAYDYVVGVKPSQDLIARYNALEGK